MYAVSQAQEAKQNQKLGAWHPQPDGRDQKRNMRNLLFSLPLGTYNPATYKGRKVDYLGWDLRGIEGKPTQLARKYSDLDQSQAMGERLH